LTGETDGSLSSGLASWRRELLAGATTFLTMSYIVAVNPEILSAAGMPRADVVFATCVATALATALIGLWARYPFAMAPGMGLNAFFAFTVCGQYGFEWPAALAAVLVAGVLFLALSAAGLQDRIVAAVPPDLVRAIAAGIGLFIAFIGLEHAGVVVDHPATLVTMGDLTEPSALIAVGGIALTAAMLAARVPGAILIGIAATTAVAIAFGVTPPPERIVSLYVLPEETLGAALPALGDLLQPEMIVVVFTFLFLDLFDTMGTLLALGYATGHVREDGTLPRARRAFTADAIGTVGGALLGTSTVTTYIESATGVVAGGRTGLTALVTAGLFLLMLPLAPLITAVPQIATAPALVVVGALMFSGAGEINWKDPVIAIPALVTILAMPATFNISNGLGLGFVAMAVTYLASGRGRRLGWPFYAVAAAFVVFFAVRIGG
jgi:AGZA family xanthine/uracil permease-like MFS transporter